MCAATKKGARGQIRMQFSSFSQLDRSDNQTSMLKGLVAIAKSSGTWKDGRRGYRRAGIDVVVLRSVHVPLRVFSCGEAEPGDPLGGAMQLGGGGVAKRRTMSAAGARKLGGRSDGGQGQSGGEGVALL